MVGVRTKPLSYLSMRCHLGSVQLLVLGHDRSALFSFPSWASLCEVRNKYTKEDYNPLSSMRQGILEICSVILPTR